MAENIVVPVALFFLDKVLSSLDQIPLQSNVQQEAKDIKNSLRTMKAYLWDVEGNQGSEVLKDRVKQVRAIAYETEDVLDEFILHVTVRIHSHIISKKAHEFVHTLTNWIPLRETSSKIKEIKRRIAEIPALDPLRGGDRGLTVSGEGPSSSSRAEHPLTFPHVGDRCELVGFEKPRQKLILQLEGADRTQKTISLVGPCGSGKSMLAKNVYNITRGQRRFDCYAWVHVSQSPKLDDILSSLSKQFCASMNQEPIPHENEDTLAKLGNYLQQKSYVVFLDDIWSKKDWEYIQNALPNGSNRSRTVITTRNSDVASFCSESSDIHYLEGLSYQEAWQLFCRKAFRASKCPQELEDWSQKIVKRCEGNPFAIVAVGTMLSKKQQIPTEWKRMHDNLVSEIGTDSSLSIIDKLLTSYKDLPWYLKTCFLYFSLFPEDYSLERGRLVRLWMAEGFVRKTTGPKTLELEEVAEDYLKELVGRGLVHENRRDFDGRVRDCRVLNFVHEFIVQKSEEQNFVSVHLTEADTCSTEKPRRLSINTIAGSGTKSSPSGGGLSSVRSTFYFKNDELSNPSVIRDILRCFKLLKDLDLRDAPLDEFPEEIVGLTLLRYLSLRRTNIKKIPKSIKKLPYLETLDLKQTRVTELPKQINQLHKLRHLLVSRVDVKNNVRSVEGMQMVGGIGALTELQKLSLVKPDKHRKIIKELGALIQLRKLGLTQLKREDGKDLCTSIQSMKNLSTLDLSSTHKQECLHLADMQSPPLYLQRLYLEGRLEKFPEWISSLINLLRIRLKWSRLESGSSPLEILQELPNLMELEMVDAFTGDHLLFQAGRFKRLKKLHIEQFDRLNTVIVEEGAMSGLQKLTLRSCVNLEMIPLGIHNLTELKELLLYDMRVLVDKLQKSSEDREMVSHIPVIHSFVPGANGSWSLPQNLCLIPLAL